MMIVIGLIVVFGLVFGGFVLSGGSFEVILHALPYEGMMIFGACAGIFIMANSVKTIVATMKAIGKSLKGPKWKAEDYSDLLSLMYELVRLYKSKGPIELEQHIENPQTSVIFARYAKLKKDQASIDLLIDSLRMVTMNFDDPHQLEDIIEKKLDAKHTAAMAPVSALTAIADALPAIGIVAAVLGVIKTMSAVDQPPAIIGMMIGSAMVGTFLGVFLAYCAVAPLVARIQAIEDQDHTFGTVIRDVVIAVVNEHPVNICIEIGRGCIPPSLRPSFSDTEEMLRSMSREA